MVLVTARVRAEGQIMAARILEGDFEIEGTVSWMHVEDGRFRFLDPDAPRKPWWAKPKWVEYGIDDVATVNHIATEVGPGVGLLFGLLMFPLDPRSGLDGITGVDRYEVEFEIVFRDGKRVEVQASERVWQQIARTYRKARRKARRDARRRGARRRGVEGTHPHTPSRRSEEPSFDALGRPRAR